MEFILAFKAYALWKTFPIFREYTTPTENTRHHTPHPDIVNATPETNTQGKKGTERSTLIEENMSVPEALDAVRRARRRRWNEAERSVPVSDAFELA